MNFIVSLYFDENTTYVLYNGIMHPPQSFSIVFSHLLQVYFRYPSPAAGDGDQRSVSHQLVQCVYKKTSYPSPIQVQ